jgi:hypothetical protein
VSKAAIEAVTRYLAVELAPDKIICNCISPGVVVTGALDFFPRRDAMIAHAVKHTPAGRIATPEDVGALAAWLIARFVPQWPPLATVNALPGALPPLSVTVMRTLRLPVSAALGVQRSDPSLQRCEPCRRADERPEIAGLFTTRLKRGMRLQSDPTIIYGISKGEPLYNKAGQRRTLYRSEIDRHTEWNTYQVDGLPKTPICNPGADAIRAVLDPPETEYIFFVADGKGGHLFAKTNAEHERNVAEEISSNVCTSVGK